MAANSFWLNNPTQTVSTGTVNYTPKYTSGAIGNIINQIGSYLKPQEAFDKQLSYEQYAQPQREAFNVWEQQMYQPEFQKYTMNPFQQKYAQQAAGGNYAQLGAGKNMYDQARQEVQQPYYNQLEQSRQSYEDMMRQGYNQKLQQYYESPIAFTNYTNF
jgi:hypothetical protein